MFPSKFYLIRSCLLITLINCLKSYRSSGLLFKLTWAPENPQRTWKCVNRYHSNKVQPGRVFVLFCAFLGRHGALRSFSPS